MALANREIMVVAMIEDRAGVENIDAIAAVPGIDMILEDAVDLSQSLGVPGQMQHPEVQSAIRSVAAACAAHALPFCAIPRADGQHEAWCQAGVRAFLLGDDRGLSFRALKAHLGKRCGITSCGHGPPAFGVWLGQQVSRMHHMHHITPFGLFSGEDRPATWWYPMERQAPADGSGNQAGFSGSEY